MNCMDIIGIRNHFLWEPHMQIYFYWLYDHIVNCIGFNRWNYLLAAMRVRLGFSNPITSYSRIGLVLYLMQIL